MSKVSTLQLSSELKVLDAAIEKASQPAAPSQPEKPPEPKEEKGAKGKDAKKDKGKVCHFEATPCSRDGKGGGGPWSQATDHTCTKVCRIVNIHPSVKHVAYTCFFLSYMYILCRVPVARRARDPQQRMEAKGLLFLKKLQKHQVQYINYHALHVLLLLILWPLISSQPPPSLRRRPPRGSTSCT